MTDLNVRGGPGYPNPRSFGGIIYGLDDTPYRRLRNLFILAIALLLAIALTGWVVLPST